MLTRKDLVKMALSLCLVVFIAWSFKSALISDAGFDRAPETPRTQTLSKVAGLTTDMDFEEFKRNVLSPIMVVRDVFSDGHRVVREHIKDQFTKLNWAVEEDSFTAQTPLGSVDFINIIATTTYPANEYLVLACHYDSKYFKDFVFIGATDSAVPCAININVAQTLNKYLMRQPTPKYGIKMIFFDGEEALVQWTETDSIYGSKNLANKMSRTKVQLSADRSISQLQQINLFVLLDLIGTSTTTFRNIKEPTSRQFQRLALIEREMKRGGLLAASSKSYFQDVYINYEIQDDHLPFERRGVPILHLISIPFPSEWHKASDNESALDYDVIHDVIKVVRMFVVDYLELNLS